MMYRGLFALLVGVIFAVIFGWLMGDIDAEVPFGIFVGGTVWMILWLGWDEDQQSNLLKIYQ